MNHVGFLVVQMNDSLSVWYNLNVYCFQKVVVTKLAILKSDGDNGNGTYGLSCREAYENRPLT